MENNTTDNIINQANNIPVNGAEPQVQSPAQPVQPDLQNTAPHNLNQQAFYNNYSKQPGTVAYNVPTYTPVAQQTPVYKSVPVTNNQSPSVIYNNAQTGNTPQYHYGNPTAPGILNNTYLDEQNAKQQQERKDSKTLRTLGNFAGLALIVCLLRSSLLSSLVVLFPSISGSMGGLSLFNMFYQVFVIGSTFLILHFILKGPQDKITKVKKYKSEINLGAPNNPLKTFLLILIGLAGCMVANYVTSVASMLFELIDFDSGYTSFENPDGVLETIVMFVGVSIIPPLIEEFSMRGVLLSSMQRYGNTFAIFATAFVFGIFHANFTQIPFAFMCGLFFAYVTIATNSLWPAIIIHALNNSLSCVSNVLMQHYDENAANIFFYVSSALIIVLGIIALVIYVIRYKNERILKDNSLIADFSPAKKFRKFMSAPGMIIATVIYSVEALLVALMSTLGDKLGNLTY